MLNVLDLGREYTRVVVQLVLQRVVLLLRVLLQEQVVLVQHLDGFVDLEDLPRLDVFKVNLPLLLFLAVRGHLLAQVTQLLLRELLRCADDFLKALHLTSHSFISDSGMFECRLLHRVLLLCSFLQCALECQLP